LNNKALFKKFSEKHSKRLSFSMHYNWWNEVVEEHWDVAVVANKEEIKAVWPYFIRKKGPWKMIAQAHLTPYAGPFLVYPEGQKEASKISFEHKIHKELIEQLPTFAELDLSFPIDFTNGLAFQWCGFEEKRKYTFLLSLQQSEEELWSNLRENIRRQIRKAEKTISIQNKFDYLLLEDAVKDSFKQQASSFPLPDKFIERVVSYIEKYNCGQVYLAKEDNQLHAALGVIYDSNTAYYLLGGSFQAYKNSGAMSLLMWNAIKDAKHTGIKQFNFEGSSIPSIENYLRGFGGKLNSFCRMTKYDSKSLAILKNLKA